MSEAVTALQGARFDGLVQIQDMGLHGMITLRGEVPTVAKAVKSAMGIEPPEQRRITSKGEKAVAWMSPDELLLLCLYSEVAQTLEKLQEALGSAHALAVDVSDARAMMGLSGTHVRDVIAKLCPLDMAPGMFDPGMIRRTRMAQVPAALWMPDGQTVQVICFRSVADYVFGVLKAAAMPESDVGVFSAR